MGNDGDEGLKMMMAAPLASWQVWLAVFQRLDFEWWTRIGAMNA
jgi:hypothetical protein